jgi:hypothetical protein
MAQVREQRPDSGLGFLEKKLDACHDIPFLLGSRGFSGSTRFRISMRKFGISNSASGVGMFLTVVESANVENRCRESRTHPRKSRLDSA